MIRLVFIAVIATGCANERGLVVGAGDDPVITALSELLHRELAQNPEGARRAGCGDALDCITGLRAGSYDVAVLDRDELEWLAPRGELVIAAQLKVERSFALVTRRGGVLGTAPQIAVGGRFASRATGGLADLARDQGLSARPLRIDDPEARAGALAGGAVDAAVFESWRAPIDSEVVATIPGSPLIVAARAAVWERQRDRDAIGRAAGVLTVSLVDFDRVQAAIAGGVDPVDALDALRGERLTLAADPELRGWVPAIERALAARGPELHNIAPADADLALLPAGAAVPGGDELIAIFEGHGLPSVELWSKAGLLDAADARRVIGVTAYARLPGGDRPSVWRRVSTRKNAPARGASRWLDTLLNILVGSFLIWLLVLIVRSKH